MKRCAFLMNAFAGLLFSSTGANAATPPASGTTAENKARIEGVTSKDVAGGFDDPNSPVEKQNQTYRFVGARFRYVVIPKFYMNLFGDGGTSVGVPAVGPEFTIRKNGFEYVLSVMYASYAMAQTPFKSKTDQDVSYEIVDANLKSLYLMSDFLWSTDLDPKFSILYGAGFGLGLVFGDIHRVQSYPLGGTPSDPYGYLPCASKGVPNGNYCGTDNDHYGDYSEASWANGGSKPIIFPWLALQTGVRFKPSKHIMGRLDLGWNLLNGPFFGLALNYGL